MSEILSTNPLAIRYLILYEVLLKRTVEEGYQNLCEALGNNQYDYVDYQFWYYRFYHGNVDLEYDRSADPKQLVLFDLPSEILGIIVGELDIKDRMRTRKVCHLLRDTVDRQPIVISDCTVSLPFDCASSLELNEYSNHYSQEDQNCVIYWNHPKRSKEIQINEAYHMDIVLNDLAILFKSSNVRIDDLELVFGREAEYGVDSCLRLIRDISNLHVGRLVLKVENTKLALSALSSFKTGSFRCLTIEFSEPEKEVGILYDSRIIGTEQFRQAEEIDIAKYGIIDPIHLESFYHCNRFTITLSSLSAENILQLKDALAISDNFEACFIYLSRPLNLSNIGKSLEANVPDGAPFFRCEYPRPDTDSYLDIQIRPSKVFIFCYSTLESGEDDENSK